MTWEDALDLSPRRLKFIANAIQRRWTEFKSATFDAHVALTGDEKALSRLNAELREL